jgi:hypothetical protein
MTRTWKTLLAMALALPTDNPRREALVADLTARLAEEHRTQRGALARTRWPERLYDDIDEAEG